MSVDPLVSAVFAAFLLDQVFGDPETFRAHPVRVMGRLACAMEAFFAGRLGRSRLSGFFFALVIVLGAFFTTHAVVFASARLHPVLGWGVSTLLLYTTFASKCLSDEALAVARALAAGDLALARKQLARIVGRDTDALDAQGVARAGVESVAESTVDGVISPLFYAFLGGAPLAMAFKAVSTLDSLAGYKNERYEKFGWAAARLDDLANFIPARLSAFMIALAAWFLAMNPSRAFQTAWRDGGRHASPNAGIPEAAFAGALGLALGGPAAYGGEVEERSWIGDPLETVTVESVVGAVRLSRLTAWLSLAAGLAVHALA